MPTVQQLLGDAQFQKNEPFVRAALAGEPQRFGRQFLKADGTPTFVDAQYLPDRDQSGAVIGFYVLVTDVTELRSTQQRLEAINAKLLVDSTTDYLTGLSNRRTFSEKSQAAADDFVKRGATYGLILLDLDDFKLVNDRFGHKIGDDVLRALGRILREQIRGNDDVAARLGGEEFAVLCIGELNEQLLCSLAERIRNQVNLETVASGKGAVRFTSSFGVACCCEGDLTWKDIYARADAALYEAKSLGKNRVAGSTTKAVSLPDMRSVRPAPEKVACLGLHGSEKPG
jgi:diguanylate cyclase (GGDEF)-like protein